MTTAFPSGLDNFTNPTPADKLSTPTVLHSDQHTNANDAIEALEAKVGVNGSADTSSLDYKVNHFGHVHGVTRWVSDGGTSFDYPDFVSLIETVSVDGLMTDPLNYSLSGTTTIVFDGPVLAGKVIVSSYVLETA